ncbi:uncharacterized protein [Ptychodera flava]|uniref:uncharacterized protein n=1 Tax=Ptychodera flava TaxID=63121 RepID=UPI00396AA9B4
MASEAPTSKSSTHRRRRHQYYKHKAFRTDSALVKLAIAAGAGCLWSAFYSGVDAEVCPRYKDFLGRRHEEIDCSLDENGPHCCGLRSLLYCCKDFNYSISNDKHVANIIDRSFNKDDIMMILLYMGVGLLFAMTVFFYNHWCGNRSSTRP